MMLLECYINDETKKRLEFSAKEMGRTIEDLAESAISETALQATKFATDEELDL